MGKAADIEIDPREPFGLTAARVVRVRTGELVEQADGVLDTNDIERVHDMRVTSRRLRAALEIFQPCFPKRPYRDVLADVKRLADALGARRDPDVHIEGMHELAAAVEEPLRAGIEALADSLRAEQAAGNDTLAAELERMHASDLHGRLLALADAAEARISPLPPASPWSGDGAAPAPQPEPTEQAEEAQAQ
jgi:CHAD domain-containing protein